MPVCSSGTSAPRAGVADDIILTAAVLSSILPAGAVWLEPFIGAIAGITELHLPTLCAVDPPADPGITGADILSLVTLGPGPLTASATAKLEQLFARYAWYVFCQCTSVTTPAAPTFPTAPSGLPSINPTGLVGVPAGACATYTALRLTDATVHPIMELLSGTYINYTGGPVDSSLRVPIPTGAISVQWTCANNGPGAESTATTPHWTPFLNFYTGTTFISHVASSTTLAGTTGRLGEVEQSAVAPIPSGADSFNVTASSPTAMVSNPSLTVQFFCSTGVATAPPAPCCTASDPITVGMLTQILQMVTLLQRQAAPFAYVTGTLHSGLSGTGNISVQGVLGALLNASVPARAGVESGTPETVFDIGWINFGTADGYTENRQIRTDSQVVLPTQAGLYTLIGYTLLPGVTLSVTELRREA